VLTDAFHEKRRRRTRESKKATGRRIFWRPVDHQKKSPSVQEGDEKAAQFKRPDEVKTGSAAAEVAAGRGQTGEPESQEGRRHSTFRGGVDILVGADR
jgi:hypothetical protein